MLTKEKIKQMKEDQLCKDVIIPLLKAMKFRDVTSTHGGISEQGRDIVCWRPDDLNFRENYALVVKAKDINGQANTREGSAGEVFMQIRQAFGSSYPDPISLQDQTVNICWVVTNRTISPNAETSIRSALNSSNAERNIRMVSGEKLWEMVEQYLVKEIVQQKIQDLSSILSDLDTHYMPEIVLSEQGFRVSIREKFAGAAQQKPINLKGTFVFPDTIDGKKIRYGFENHIATGSSISMPANYFQIEEIPDVLKPFFDHQQFQNSIIEISTASDHHFKARLEIITDDGIKETVDYIDLKVVKSGINQSTMESVNNILPIKLELVFHHPVENFGGKVEMNITWSYFGKTINVGQLLKVLNLQYCFSKSATFKLIDLETQLVVLEKKGGFQCQPPHPSLLDMVSDIVKVQEKTKTLLMLPIREYTDDEGEVIIKLRTILHEARIDANWNKFQMTFGNIDETLVTNFSQQPMKLIVKKEESINFFGIEIPLGVVSYILHGAFVENWDALRIQFETASKAEEFQVPFYSKDGDKLLEIIYHDWEKEASSHLVLDN